MNRLFCVVAVIVLFNGIFHGDAHVMGVDFGSEYIKVAAPHEDYSVDIVLNELSRRKTDNYIGFRNDERYIGDQARSLAARFPLKTACAINQLIGLHKSGDSNNTLNFNEMMYEFVTEYTSRNTASVPFDDAQGTFLSEELYAMMLSYIKGICIKDGVVDPNGVVITIPFHTSSGERRAILDAAHLAGTNVLGFMHSTTAAAFYYGMRHRGFGDRTVNLIVFDVGTTHTEVGVYRFTPAKNKGRLSEAFGTLSTITVLEDRSLGGRAFDVCIAKIIEKEAVGKLGIKTILGGRTTAQLKSQFSLMRAANKVRETLSVNSQTPYTVEGIAPDKDFMSSLTRDTFEQECAPLFERVKKLAHDIIPASGLKSSEIQAFELMGGAARTPKIISDISSVLGRPVDRTLNMDEAAAVGAAYYAVKLSPFYSSKSFRLLERVPLQLSFSAHPPLKKNTSPAHRLLVDEEFAVNDAVSVTFNRTDDFLLRLYEGHASKEPFAEVHVGKVRAVLEKMHFFKPLVSHPNSSHIIRLQMRVNETGLLHIDEAVAVVRYAVNVTEKNKKNVTGADGATTLEDVTTFSIRMRHKTLPLDIDFKFVKPPQISDADMANSMAKIAKIDKREHLKHERAVARNNLEAYIFWMKSDGVLDNTRVRSILSEKTLQEVETMVAEAQDWMEDGRGSYDTCTTVEYSEYLVNLKAAVQRHIAEPTEDDRETPNDTADRSTGDSTVKVTDGAEKEEAAVDDNDDEQDL